MIKRIKLLQIVLIVISIVTAGLFGAWYWYNQSYLAPQNVFWASMDRNLRTASVTKTLQNLNDESSQQVTSFYNGELLNQSVVKLTEATEDGKRTIKTETIGTMTNDYLRYAEIVAEGYVAPEGVIDVWAKSDTNNLLLGEILDTPVLFGQLSPNQRTELVKLMQDSKVFETDFYKANRNAKINGKKVYEFDAKVNVMAYLKVFMRYFEMIGQPKVAEQLGGGQSVGSFNAIFYINPISRELVQITPKGSTTSYNFANYGVRDRPTIPTNVTLTIDELQNRLSGAGL